MLPLARRRHPLHRALCLLLIGTMLPGGAGWAYAQAPPTAKTPSGQLLSTACVTVIARPAQVLRAPQMAMLPIEVMQAAGLKELGLDPLAAEQITLSVEPPLAGPPNYIVRVDFAEAASLPQGQLVAHTVEADLGGKSYLQSLDQFAPSFYQPDQRTLWAMPDSLLQRVVRDEAALGGGRLSELVETHWQQDDLFVLADLEVLRPLINVAMAAGEIPPELASLREIPNLVKLLRVRLNLSRNAPSEIVVGAVNERAAERLIAIFEQFKAMGVAQVDAETARFLNDPDPVQQAVGRYQQRLSKMWEDAVQLQRDGSEIVLMRANLGAEGEAPVWSVATISVLVALLLPAVQAAREAARRTTSMNNLKQLALALFNYEATHGHFPAHATYDDQGQPLLSWRVHILPYIEEQALYDEFRLDEPWDSEHNQRLIARMPAVFLDPSSVLALEDGRTHYLAVQGADAAFSGDAEGRRLRDFTDGMSNSLLLAQVGDAGAQVWTKPADWEVGPETRPQDLRPFLHPGGFLAAMADGSVQFFSESIDPQLLRAVLTIDGGEVIPR
jgi:hypothetical protein